MKPRLRLIRIYDAGENGTFGVIVSEPGAAVCRTAELNWRDNRRNISCIPSGEYNVAPHDSPTFGECFFVSDVSGRSNVLIHAGNWAGQRGVAGVLSDTEGCILVGDRVRVIEKNGIKQPGVNRSKDTLKRLLKEYPMGFSLIIESV